MDAPRLNRAMQCATCNARAPRHKDVFDALRAFRPVRRDPENADAHLGLGTALRNLEKHDEAKAAYERAIELGPQNANAHNHLGDALFKMENFEQAEVAFGNACKIQPEDPTYAKNLGLSLRQQGKHGEAADAFKRSIELDPQNPEAHNSLGDILYKMGAWKEAETSFGNANKMQPENVMYAKNLGLSLAQQVDAFKRTIELDPQNPEAHNSLGDILYKMGAWKEAETSFGNANKMQPENVMYAKNLGLSLAQQGKNGRATRRRIWTSAPCCWWWDGTKKQ